jgi:hypothetical protein
MFGAPEKRTSSDGSSYYYISIKTPISLDYDIQWEQTQLKEDIGIQSEIVELRGTVLQAIAGNKTLFANPPNERSLSAMASKWGLLLSRSGIASWSDANIWQVVPEALHGKKATVHLQLLAVHISPASIRPVWGLKVHAILPEAPVIDFVFDVPDDVQSVHSADIEADLTEEVVQLADLEKEKREAKQRVHELVAQAQAARRLAEHALDAFMEEYDLSEDESDFSDMD